MTSGKMIVYESLEQGSEEWFQIRKGRATASKASMVLTPTGKLSKSRIKYMRHLAAECVADDPLEFMGNKYTDWGNEHEQEARNLFAEACNVKVQEVGFCTRPDGVIGCSPDGLLVGPDNQPYHGLEIKCPSRDKHVEYLMEGELPPEYKLQVHWSIATTGLDGWWFMSYFPTPKKSIKLKPFILYVEADDFTETVRKAQDDFILEYNKDFKKILDKIVLKVEGGDDE